MVLRLSRFGSGFRERVDRVRVFWSAQRGARIAVPRCSRVYIWSAKTRRLSVRVHQNHTLRSTLLTMQGGYGPLSLWQQHRCSSWRQTQCKDGLISSRQQQQQRTSLRQHSTRVYRPGCRAQVPGLAQCVRLSLRRQWTAATLRREQKTVLRYDNSNSRPQQRSKRHQLHFRRSIVHWRMRTRRSRRR